MVLFGGVRGLIQWGGLRGFFSFFGYNEIRSMSVRYTSYWNAFLFQKRVSTILSMGGCVLLHQGGVHGFNWGACVVLFRGGCMVLFGGHAWFYSGGCMVLFRGVCMVLFGGCAWFYSGGAWFYSAGGACMVLFSGGACMVFSVFFGYNEIRSMSGRYASYWNAFLLDGFSGATS